MSTLASTVGRHRVPRPLSRSMLGCVVALGLLGGASATVRAQFNHAIRDGTVTITRGGPNGLVGIPDTINGMPVTSIGFEAFRNRRGLTGVTIPDSVTSIGDSAFSGCTGLTSVTIPDSVTSIGDATFHTCSLLTSVFFRGSPPNLGSRVLYSANNVTVYYLPGSTGWGSASLE